MRSILTATVGLAVLAAACDGPARGGTGASAGTSAGGAPTSGGSATSGGGTGGSTTSSGGVPDDLPAGTPCSSDSACASGNCGVDGSGHCCLSPDRCPLGDGGEACGPVGCDDTGACVYADAGASCGVSSCFNTLFIPLGSCDGSGSCNPGTPAVCPAQYKCNDAGTCNKSCNSSADCAANHVCNASRCDNRRSAGGCTEDDDCVSSICSGLDGGADSGGVGLCCANLCFEPNPVCHSTTCAEATGDCIYPVGMSCAATLCEKDRTFVPACDMHGSCIPAITPCPDDFGCNGTNTACNTSCTRDADCASATFCNVDAGTCGPM
jgi:hypothetical protein